MATLIGQLGDFELAEDALQDSVEQALSVWPERGIPDHPDAWLLTASRRRAFNVIKRQRTFERKQPLLAQLSDESTAMASDIPGEVTEPIVDDRLRLIFTCCHPALGLPARVALTLRTVGGLSTTQIARAFMVSEPTMARRLVRAKRKISGAAIPYRVPPPEQWVERLDAVLYVVYFIFNEGYAGTQDPAGTELVAEAVRLGNVLLQLLPDEPEVGGLLALMLLHDSRRAARVDSGGALMTLETQDRSLWDRAKVRDADTLLKKTLRQGQPGAYQLQAAISGVHAHARRFADTDWAQIVGLYELLESTEESAVVRLNACVARSFAGQLEPALKDLDALEQRLESYQPYHAARADMLRRAERPDEAAVAYRRALDLTQTVPERRFLEVRLAELD